MSVCSPANLYFVLAFTIYHYAIVAYIIIDTFRIIQCQTYLHSAS